MSGLLQMSEAEYHADPCSRPSLSASIAKLLIAKSPAHAHHAHPRLGGGAPDHSSTFDFGTAGHTLLLREGAALVPVWIEDVAKGVTPEKWAPGPRSEVETLVSAGFRAAPDWRTKVAREARDTIRRGGRVPLLQKDYDRYTRTSDKWRQRLAQNHPSRRAISFSGESERVLIWESRTDDGKRVLCRCRIDHIEFWGNRVTVYDLKTVKGADDDACVRAILRLQYHIQRAAYIEAVETEWPKLAGRVEYRWIFAETTEVAAVNVFEASGSLATLGRALWRRSVNIWHHCLETYGNAPWPDYSTHTKMADVTSWQIEKAMGDDYDDAA